MPHLLLICLLLTLSGCAFPQGASQETIETRGTEFEDLSRSRIVSVVDEPYLGARPIPLPKNTEFSSGVFSKQVILNKYGSLDDLCATVGKLTGLPITVDSPAASSAVKTTAPKESDLDAQLEAALGTSGKRPANAAVGVVPQSRSRGMRIAYEGTVKGLLDLLASRFNVAWEYSADEGVVFSSSAIRTFTLWAAPGEIKYQNTITSQSNETNAAGSSSTSGTTGQAAGIETSQTHETEVRLNIWKEVEEGVKKFSPRGDVVISQVAGTVTVRDTAVALRKVGKFIDDLNERLARQIALSVKVWALELTDSTDAGLNLQMLFENPDVKVFAGAMPVRWLGAGGELSAAVVDGKLKDSTAILRALRSVGQATQVTSAGGVVMHSQPMPVQALRREAYLASSSISTTEYGETAELTPGEITTGFAMTVIPSIKESRRVILYTAVDMANLDDLTEFTSGNATVQQPKRSTRSFKQQTSVKMGQTLVLAGFEQESDGRGTVGGLLGFGRTREYGKTLIVITISTESGDV